MTLDEQLREAEIVAEFDADEEDGGVMRARRNLARALAAAEAERDLMKKQRDGYILLSDELGELISAAGETARLYPHEGRFVRTALAALDRHTIDTIAAERDRLREEVGEALGEAFLLLGGIDYDEGSRIDRAVDALDRARAALAEDDT